MLGHQWIGEHWWAAAVASGRFDIGNHGWDHVSPSVTAAGERRREGRLVPARRHVRGGRPAGARRARLHRGESAQSRHGLLRLSVRRREQPTRRTTTCRGTWIATAPSPRSPDGPARSMREATAGGCRATRAGWTGARPPSSRASCATSLSHAHDRRSPRAVAAARRAARDPRPRRRHRAPRARADRRVAQPLSAPSRDRGRRALAGRGAPAGRRACARSSSRARRASRGPISSAASARRSASTSSTCTTSRAAATASSRRSPRSTFRTATRSTTSTSRARRSCSSASTACIAARRPTRRSARAASRAQPAFAGIDIAAWRVRHRALLARASFLIAPSRWTGSDAREVLPRPADRRDSARRAGRMGDGDRGHRGRRRADDRAVASRRTAASRRRRADGRRAGRRRPRQGCAPARAARRSRARDGRARALRR